MFNSTIIGSMHDLLFFGPPYIDKQLASIDNSFWRDVLLAFRGYKELPLQDDSIAGTHQYDPLWYNEKVKIRGKVICYKSWIERGMWYVRQMFSAEGLLMSYEEFANAYFETPFTVFLGHSESCFELIYC